MTTFPPGRSAPLWAIVIGVALVFGAIAVLPVSAPSALLRPGTSEIAPPSSYYPSLSSGNRAFPNGLNASSVLGKLNFTSSPALTNASTLVRSTSSAFGADGDLWVADSGDNRVVEYATPFTTDAAARVVLGQPNTSANSPGEGRAGLSAPSAVAFDSSGDLWVVDTDNDRVLEYAAPFTTNESASLVLGQPGFNFSAPGSGSDQLDSPTDIAFDSTGDLWVADSGNNRVVEFLPPFSSGMSASLVLGQPEFGISSASVSAATLSGPIGLAFNGTGALWVADSDNNRLLAFDPPFANGENASFVLGQPNFGASSPGVGPASFTAPGYLAFAGSALWVADAGNNRVLEFAGPITATSAAMIVLGQPTAIGANAGTSATNLSAPEQAIPGPGGSVFVTEFTNSRVIRFPGPITNGSAGNLVLGQVNLSTSLTAPTLSNIGVSASLAFGPYGDLWVADTLNNRVLEFPEPFSPGESAAIVIGQTTFNNHATSVTSSGLLTPWGITFTPNGVLWVADSGHNRVLGFRSPQTTGMSASIVLGQPNFTASAPGTTGSAMDFPTALATNASGNLFVADTLNNRVLEFRAPQLKAATASLVLGQANFNSAVSGTSPRQMSLPDGLAEDTNGTLYVSDRGNNRVLAFAPPFVTNEAATGVLGQTNYYSAGWGVGPAALDQPVGLAIDLAGYLWVADSGNNRLVRYPLPILDGATAVSELGQRGFGSNTPGTSPTQLRDPLGVLVDSRTGNLFVADSGNARVLVFPSNAQIVATTTVTLTSAGAGNVSAPTTGITLNITGGPASGTLLVVTQLLATPVSYGAGPFANQSYFDIAVAPNALGSGVACFRQPNATFTGGVDYYNGLNWVPASGAGIVQGKACATFPLALLNGTNIAVALPSPPTTTPGNLDYILYGAIGFVVGAAVAIVVYNIRPRKPPVVATAPAGAPPTPPTGG